LIPSSPQDLLSLADIMRKHIGEEIVSFHTPGHKGHCWQADGSFARDSRLDEDLTELPGLDELAYPSGPIADLEKRAAKIWDSSSTLISVNGASAGIVAAIMLLAKHGTHILVPRNCHRSVIHGLILSGLQPVWFEPDWHEAWYFWGAPSLDSIESCIAVAKKTIASRNGKIAGIIITSPTYAGALANIRAIAEVADKNNIPLVVDEAQGAHLLWSQNSKFASLNNGADIVIHSLHKTLSCPTQTGLVHLSEKALGKYGFSEFELRSGMSLIQSSSPSYLFLGAVDRLVTALETGKAQERLEQVEKLGLTLQHLLKERKDIELYQPQFGTVATDSLIRHSHLTSQQLQELLIQKGIFPEAILGSGLLFFLGIGSKEDVVEILLAALDLISLECPSEIEHGTPAPTEVKPSSFEQVFSPREAFFMPSQMVPREKAAGQISAECRAPCPPGWPLLIPGQRIGEEVMQLEDVDLIRIIKPT